MDEKQTRSSRHEQGNAKFNTKQLSAVIGTTLALTPAVSSLSPISVQATEWEQQDVDYEQAFVASIGSSAATVASANDLYASVMIAQALLESSYGMSGLAAAPNYNLFGVKGSYNGETVYMETSEYLNGEWVTMTEPFRSYSSYAESFQDHADVLRSTVGASGDYHYSGVWKSNTTSYLDATAALAGRYATDPEYSSKLNWLIANFNLTAYDFGGTSNLTETADEVNTSTASLGNQSYTVVSGDTLWGIAEKAGVSVDQLMNMNGLTAELITVGQVLQLG